DGLDHRIVGFARLAEHEAQAADVLGESKLLGVERADLERRRAGNRWSAVAILGVLVDGDHADVLKQDVGYLGGAVGVRQLPGDEHVDAVVWLDEAGYAGDVVDADRGGAHAFGQQRGDRGALAFAGDLVCEDRFV